MQKRLEQAAGIIADVALNEEINNSGTLLALVDVIDRVVEHFYESHPNYRLIESIGRLLVNIAVRAETEDENNA